jgi:aspartate/methionine/tyrosine aminotransferase
VARINSLARERGWGIIADITYQAFLGASDMSVGMLAPERTIFCDSASKAWTLPGLRLGFAVCREPRLAALLRALKSARSLLPSSLKVAFFGHLLTHCDDIPEQIVKTVNERRQRFRQAWPAQSAAAAGLELSPVIVPGLYEVVYTAGLAVRSGLTSAEFAAALLRQFGMRVMPDTAFFPSGRRRAPERPFIRLSLGLVDEMEAVAQSICECAFRQLGDV